MDSPSLRLFEAFNLQSIAQRDSARYNRRESGRVEYAMAIGAQSGWRAAIMCFAALGVAACSEADEQALESGGFVAPEAGAEDEINLDIWLERLEVGSRELYSAREAVVAAVGLQEGDWVADIGAGTGLYSLMFAEAVGEGGQVFAEDIEPLFLDLIIRRSADNGANNITAVLGREEDVMLPAGAMDVAFIADTYHYFDRREAIMRTVYDALKPGGILNIVEYDMYQDRKMPENKSHVRFGKKTVIAEIEYIGFEFIEEVKVDGLEDNYFVRFKKPE